MNYEEMRAEVRNGDLLGYHGTALFSRLIERLTGHGDPTAWSHLAVFFWQGEGLWLAQELEGTGFGCYPASQLIGKFIKERGTCWWGRAPAVVENNPGRVTDLIATYRVTPRLRPYGYGSLFRILMDERTDPFNVQAVCSTFAQQAWELCGYKATHLLAPQDFKSLVTQIVAVE